MNCSGSGSSSPLPLFITGDFISAAGLRLRWKIDCDALTYEDWRCIAEVVGPCLNFGAVEGVPYGGNQFAQVLQPFATAGPGGGELLIVDDVFTTGYSMDRHRGGRQAQGLVLFARNTIHPPHTWIKSIWNLSGWLM